MYRLEVLERKYNAATTIATKEENEEKGAQNACK